MMAASSKLNATESRERAEEKIRPPRGQRAFDLAVALPLTVLLTPVFAGLAALVRLDSRGPVFFLQQRVGRWGAPFTIFKFRTMVVDAERLGAQITIGRDPRITRMGHLLRRTRLDELPQLLNVLRGEMSLVGPRPEVPRYVAAYSDAQRAILSLRPGITSPASIRFRNESDLLAGHPDPETLYRSEIMPAKLSEDLAYARRATIWSDLGVVMQTLTRLLS
ncbi:MAG: sugar transferase [Blastocatellia bacterium]|nr:sugar transferase [Blastocatellia bacterium]